MRFALLLLALLATGTALAQPPAPDGQYEVVQRGSPVLGHFWAGDGLASVTSSNRSAANRFQLGAQVQFGPDYRFLVGWTIIDALTSGETSTDVGDISRFGSDINAGFFIVPQKLWVAYSLYLGTISGSNISDNVDTIGQGLGVGYRFYDHDRFNMEVEAAYTHIASQTVTTIELSTNTLGSATYPVANIWSINLRLGFDLGGPPPSR